MVEHGDRLGESPRRIRKTEAAGSARLATARRRAAARDRTRAELENSMARSRVLLRVERALRQLLVSHESLEAASLVAHSGGGRRGWAISGLALYVGDFARLDVARVPLERIVDVGIGVEGPPYVVRVVVAGEPPRHIEDEFDAGSLDAAERLLTIISARETDAAAHDRDGSILLAPQARNGESGAAAHDQQDDRNRNLR